MFGSSTAQLLEGEGRTGAAAQQALAAAVDGGAGVSGALRVLSQRGAPGRPVNPRAGGGAHAPEAGCEAQALPWQGGSAGWWLMIRTTLQ